MKFIYLIPVPNPLAFDIHVNALIEKTEAYLKKHGHSLEVLLLDETYNDLGWCEELIFHLCSKKALENFDYIIFSHSDILIKNFTFLNYISDYTFGRPFYFVISLQKLNKLCSLKVKYNMKDSSFKQLPSIFHGYKIGKQKLDISVDEGNGYRTLINVSEHGGQEVPHLHFHIFGGEKVGKMVE